MGHTKKLDTVEYGFAFEVNFVSDDDSRKYAVTVDPGGIDKVPELEGWVLFVVKKD